MAINTSFTVLLLKQNNHTISHFIKEKRRSKDVQIASCFKTEVKTRTRTRHSINLKLTRYVFITSNTLLTT